jgi:A/G-specific adenine glycosylase
VRWYRAERRDLPWRRTTDPYRIWISETMLQQTRVAAVLPYYERFVTRFPSVAALAAAPVEDVLALWAGLGYYRRARHLKKAAEIIMARHGGELPEEEPALLALPGVGRYTAGALRSIAFDRPAPILDGNVFRLLSRFLARAGTWNRSSDKERFWEIAEAVVPRRNAGDFNQALMEMGALICTPRLPECGRCPVRRRCRARRLGKVDRFPSPRQRPPAEDVERDVYVLRDRRGRVLLRQRPEGGRMGGMWELPVEAPGVAAAAEAGRFRHAVLNKRYHVRVLVAVCDGAAARRGAELRWIAREEIPAYPLTGMAKKGLRLALGAGEEGRARRRR